MAPSRPLESIFYCMKVLEVLQSLYSGVDLVIPFAIAILSKANVGVLTNFDSKVHQLIYKGRHYSYGDSQSAVLPTQGNSNGISSSGHHSDHLPGTQNYPAFDSASLDVDARSTEQMQDIHGLGESGSGHPRQGEGDIMIPMELEVTAIEATNPGPTDRQRPGAASNGQVSPNETYSQIPTHIQPFWNGQDDVFLTTGAEYDCLFGHFLVDFDNLDYMDMGIIGGLASD